MRNENNHLSLGIGALGVLIAVAASANALYKYQENWIQYRATSEQLTREKFLYLTNSGNYAVEDKFPLFVQMIENLLAKENSSWVQFASSSGKNDGKKQGLSSASTQNHAL